MELSKICYFAPSFCMNVKKIFFNLEDLIDEYKHYILNSNSLYSLYKESETEITFDLQIKILKSNIGNYYHLYCTTIYYLSGKELNNYHHNDVIYKYYIV